MIDSVLLLCYEIDMYFKKLIGKKCYLSPIDVNDAPIYTAWLNDSEVNANLTIASYVI